MNSFLKKRLIRYIFFSILILSIFLRFNQLGNNPPSLDWDEASLGYNAYALLKTGADEYGNKFPMSIRSFDDYKPPLYAYLIVSSIAFYGLNEFGVRFPSAILGVVAVILTYFFAKELFKSIDQKEAIALCSSFFMAISPWHLQFSRAAFEGNVGLTFFLLGMLLFLKGLKKPYFLLLSGISYVLSMYSYHSFRLIVPSVLLASSMIFYQALWQKKFYSCITFLSMIVLSVPIFLSIFSVSGTGARLSMVTIFSPAETLHASINRLRLDQKRGNTIGELFHNRRVTYFLAIAKGYLDHYNPDFLFLHGDGGKQHHAVDTGMLYLFELPFIIVGFVFLFQKFDRRILFFTTYFFLSPIASAISTGTPHPVRAIAMIPAFHILTALGVVMSYYLLYRIGRFFKLGIVFFVSTLFIFNFLYYLHQYYVHTPIEYGYFWQYGNKEAVYFALESEKKYNKIIMTYGYDQPYIYYLFYGKIDPLWYQNHWNYNGNGKLDRFKRIIGKYEFRPIQYGVDSRIPKTLLIGTPEEIPKNRKIIKEILFPDGRTAYRISSSL